MAQTHLSTPVSALEHTVECHFIPKCTAERDGCNLVVQNLPRDCTELDLATLFGMHGTVVSTIVYRHRETKASMGFGPDALVVMQLMRRAGFVKFDNPFSALKAILGLNGFNLNGHVIRVADKQKSEMYKLK